MILCNFSIIVGRDAQGEEQFRCTFAEFCAANADAIGNDPHQFAEFVEILNRDGRSGPFFGLGDPDEYEVEQPPMPANLAEMHDLLSGGAT